MSTALGTRLCTTENRPSGGRKPVGCTHRVADHNRAEDGLRPTEDAPHFRAGAREPPREVGGSETGFRAGARRTASERGGSETNFPRRSARTASGSRRLGNRIQRRSAKNPSRSRRLGDQLSAPRRENHVEQPTRARPNSGAKARRTNRAADASETGFGRQGARTASSGGRHRDRIRAPRREKRVEQRTQARPDFRTGAREARRARDASETEFPR